MDQRLHRHAHDHGFRNRIHRNEAVQLRIRMGDDDRRHPQPRRGCPCHPVVPRVRFLRVDRQDGWDHRVLGRVHHLLRHPIHLLHLHHLRRQRRFERPVQVRDHRPDRGVLPHGHGFHHHTHVRTHLGGSYLPRMVILHQRKPGHQARLHPADRQRERHNRLRPMGAQNIQAPHGIPGRDVLHDRPGLGHGGIPSHRHPRQIRIHLHRMVRHRRFRDRRVFRGGQGHAQGRSDPVRGLGHGPHTLHPDLQSQRGHGRPRTHDQDLQGRDMQVRHPDDPPDPGRIPVRGMVHR